jgi:hypothetical protein
MATEALQKTPIENLLMLIDQLTGIKKAHDKRNIEKEKSEELAECEATIEGTM